MYGCVCNGVYRWSDGKRVCLRRVKRESEQQRVKTCILKDIWCVYKRERERERETAIEYA